MPAGYWYRLFTGGIPKCTPPLERGASAGGGGEPAQRYGTAHPVRLRCVRTAQLEAGRLRGDALYLGRQPAAERGAGQPAAHLDL